MLGVTLDFCGQTQHFILQQRLLAHQPNYMVDNTHVCFRLVRTPITS